MPLASASTPEFATDPSTGETLIDQKTGEAVLYKEKKFKDIKLDVVRTKYWLGVGAQPSETVERILSMVSFQWIRGVLMGVSGLAYECCADWINAAAAGKDETAGNEGSVIIVSWRSGRA